MVSKVSAFLIGACLCLAGSVLAQTPTEAEAGSPTPSLLRSRVSYNLSAGAMFAGRLGSATYLSPTMSYQATNRLRLFTGLTYIRSLPGVYYSPTAITDGGGPITSAPMATNHYLVQAGAEYALSPRVSLTGTAWRDFSNLPPAPGIRGFSGGNMGSGVNVRADYHITENFSISGGVRYSTGAAPGYGMGMGPGSPYGW
ncbi:hypothetical protein GCM10011375_24280 [Hymenobacter qilianensis]|uniref:Outer membrane beta-barrel protein n=2 Tax=Hymenobacter qilianensis TaxID=1385715 RepID=A0A7H0GW55_9BACT|nr:hypothetical protein [Hymenobacter qilianensis]QNP52521.1 hypothetical protein H9L05_01705 [Hymenobacter qilianensis]GGF68422.1 hypothetical protein GCM10011375_24280 [Hymenobacter qilianensis]